MYKLSIYHPNLHSFPTLRSSDLTQRRNSKVAARVQSNSQPPSSFSHFRCRDESRCSSLVGSTVLAPEKCPDRKSTRLNSSHSQISYAVFCLKTKISLEKI